jgi:hypothetical protein
MSDAILLELVALERQEHEVSARRRHLHERIAAFPSDHAVRQERELSLRRRVLHRRIDELRVQVGLRPGPPG